MPTDITISTDKPNFLTTGLRDISTGAAYDAAKPTATIPSTTGQTFLDPDEPRRQAEPSPHCSVLRVFGCSDLCIFHRSRRSRDRLVYLRPDERHPDLRPERPRRPDGSRSDRPSRR
jgi:hypothetical protein